MAERIVIDPITRIEGHLRVEIEVTSSKPSTAPARTAAPVVEKPEEVIDLDDLVEAPPKVIETLAESRLLEAFPGAVEEDE